MRHSGASYNGEYSRQTHVQGSRTSSRTIGEGVANELREFGELASFSFATIGAQAETVAFEIVITAKDEEGRTCEAFNETVQLTTNRTTVTPTTTLAFLAGVATLNVTLTGTGAGSTITATYLARGRTIANASNTFTVT